MASRREPAPESFKFTTVVDPPRFDWAVEATFPLKVLLTRLSEASRTKIAPPTPWPLLAAAPPLLPANPLVARLLVNAQLTTETVPVRAKMPAPNPAPPPPPPPQPEKLPPPPPPPKNPPGPPCPLKTPVPGPPPPPPPNPPG